MKEISESVTDLSSVAELLSELPSLAKVGMDLLPIS
jgi:hypothetical protein